MAKVHHLVAACGFRTRELNSVGEARRTPFKSQLVLMLIIAYSGPDSGNDEASCPNFRFFESACLCQAHAFLPGQSGPKGIKSYTTPESAGLPPHSPGVTFWPTVWL